MCGSLVKIILFLFNLIFVLIGSAIIAIGTIVHIKLDQIVEKIPEEINKYFTNISILPIIIIIIGCLIVLIAFPGCCGAICESKCLLITYACVMLLLAAIKIYFAVTIFKNMGVFRESAVNFGDNIFHNSLNTTFHIIEYKLDCCGTNGPDSYDGVLEYLPPTCCAGVFDKCSQNPNIENCLCEKDHAYKDGCSQLLGYYVGLYGNYTGYGFITAILVEILAIVFATYLITNIGKSDVY